MNTYNTLNNSLIAARRLTILRRWLMFMPAMVAILLMAAQASFAQSPFDAKGSGQLSFSSTGTSSFSMTGTESHLGQFRCRGEVRFQSKLETGPQAGSGIAVFQAADGDLLVGTMIISTAADGTGQVQFSWCNSVRFSDGTSVSSTGRFAGSRPADTTVPVKTKKTVVIAIIAILIG